MTGFFDTVRRACGELEDGIAAVDWSSAGLLLMRGTEARDFLQRISTNDMRECEPGSVVQTVLVTEKAKIVDAVLAVSLDDAMLLVTGPDRAPTVHAWLDRFIIMEAITVEDITARHVCALVFGSPEKLSAAFPRPGAVSPRYSPDAFSIDFSYFARPAVLMVYNSQETMGTELVDRSIPTVSAEAFELFRIRHGIPGAPSEITDRVNPLEAGLTQAVNFTKGCYIGQEVIARLETYKKVQRRLCRVRLTPCPASSRTAEIIGEHGVHGYITTIINEPDDEGSCTALAILRSPSAGARFTLRDGVTEALVEKIFE